MLVYHPMNGIKRRRRINNMKLLRALLNYTRAYIREKIFQPIKDGFMDAEYHNRYSDFF